MGRTIERDGNGANFRSSIDNMYLYTFIDQGITYVFIEWASTIGLSRAFSVVSIDLIKPQTTPVIVFRCSTLASSLAHCYKSTLKVCNVAKRNRLTSMKEGIAKPHAARDWTHPWKTASGVGIVAGAAGSNVASFKPVAGYVFY